MRPNDEHVTLFMTTRCEVEFLEVERTTNEMPDVSRIPECFQLRLQLLTLKLRLEHKGIEHLPLVVPLLLPFKEKRHAVDPYQFAVQVAKLLGMQQELGVAEADDDGACQPIDGFKFFGPDVVDHTADRFDFLPPLSIGRPRRNQVNIDIEFPPQFDGVPQLGAGTPDVARKSNHK